MASQQLGGKVSPALTFGPDVTVGDALAQLAHANANYAVITDAGGQPARVITDQDLAGKGAGMRLGELIDPNNPALTVSPDASMEQVVQKHSKSLVLHAQIRGIVVQDGNKIVGVLPRQAVVEIASRSVKRGLERLEGGPLTTLWYECPIDHERRRVAYYDPTSPPTCKNGHLMKRVES